MTQPSTKRPPQVTLAGSVVMFASVLVVLTVWEFIGDLRSLESRESMEVFLDGPGRGLGLDLEGTIRLRHVSGTVAGACAAATAVLGWFVMRRDKQARLALAVLAVPLFLTGLVVGGFASSFVAAAAAMLWLSPAREWFATGRWTPPAPPRTRAADAAERRPAWPPSTPPTPPTSPQSGPPAGPEHGGPPAGSHRLPEPGAPGTSPYAAGTGVGPWGAGSSRVAPSERPGSLLTAVVITSVLSVLVGLVAVMLLVVAAMVPETLLTEVERQQPGVLDGVSAAELRTVVSLTAAALIALCVLALTFAAFLTVGREWARRGLMATAAFCTGLCVLASLTDPIALIPGIAAAVTVVLLNRPESRAWCAGDRTTRRP